MSVRRVSHETNPRQFRWLAVLAVLSACVYACIAFLSWQFEFEHEKTERPIVGVLLLFAVAVAGYFLAIRIALKAPQTKRLLALIIWPAIIFRVTLLFSVPIQEIDIYRYLWDGTATTAGVSPFQFSPAQVRSASSETTNDENLLKLVRLRDAQPATAEVLQRVHFGELPTIYPASSQLVFAASSLTTPSDAPVLVRVFIMKAWFVAFDVATLFIIISLLKYCRRPVGLCLIYAWCPLLMKEVANSGHLDAVAVFLTTLAVYLVVRLLAMSRVGNQVASSRADKRAGASKADTATRTGLQLTLVFVVLALAIGAKLYPIILVPLFLLLLGRQFGWRQLLIPTAAFALTTCVILAPMLPSKTTASPTQSALQEGPPAPAAAQAAADPSKGVTTFLRHWEMNDFIFLVTVENLKPTAETSAQQKAWFSVVPESVRQRLTAIVSETLGVTPTEAAFLLTRVATAIVFLIVATWLAWRAARKPDIASFCEAGFLTIAWFWLLCPTQNPWYWTWALPLLPFARGRAWLAVSGLVLIYYLRFWLSYHWPETHLLGTGYVGYAFFDFVVTWIEFAPWFGWLCVGSFLRWRKSINSAATFATHHTRRLASEHQVYQSRHG